jgi:hypothetical protein
MNDSDRPLSAQSGYHVTPIEPIPTRGTCRRCGRKRVAIRVNGRLHVHTNPNDTTYYVRRCPGSNQLPA